jgi:hypothetical protein
LPPEISRDRALLRELRGIDIVLKILNDAGLAARAADAVAWAEENADRWQSLCSDIVLTAIRLDALERLAGELLAECCDIFAVRLPMANVIGCRPVSETPVSDLTKVALTEGIITSAEIRKAENVK